MQGSQTLGKPKKSKTSQRHSAGNIDYDNLPGNQDQEELSQPMQTGGFRTRSKTVGDTAGIYICLKNLSICSGINMWLQNLVY